jgi:hypothetical protein
MTYDGMTCDVDPPLIVDAPRERVAGLERFVAAMVAESRLGVARRPVRAAR